MKDSFIIKECDYENDPDYISEANTHYSELINHILTKGLGEFGCLKVTLNSKKEALNLYQSFYYRRRHHKSSIGKFLYDNKISIIVRLNNVYFISEENNGEAIK